MGQAPDKRIMCLSKVHPGEMRPFPPIVKSPTAISSLLQSPESRFRISIVLLVVV